MQRNARYIIIIILYVYMPAFAYSTDADKGQEILFSSSPNGNYHVSIIQKTQEDGGNLIYLATSLIEEKKSSLKYQRDSTIIGVPERLLISDSGYVMEIGFPHSFGNLGVIIFDQDGIAIKAIGLEELKIDQLDPELGFNLSVSGLRWAYSTLSYCISDDFRVMFLNKTQIVIHINGPSLFLVGSNALSFTSVIRDIL